MPLPYRAPSDTHIDLSSSDPAVQLGTLFDAYFPPEIDAEIARQSRLNALKTRAGLVQSGALSAGQWQVWLGAHFTKTAYSGGLEEVIDTHPALILEFADLLTARQMPEFLAIYTKTARPFIDHLKSGADQSPEDDNFWDGFHAIWETLPDPHFAEIDHHFMVLADGSSRDGMLPADSFATELERRLIAMALATPDDFQS